MDNVTLQRIEKLHPSVREEVKQIIRDCDEALRSCIRCVDLIFIEVIEIEFQYFIKLNK